MNVYDFLTQHFNVQEQSGNWVIDCPFCGEDRQRMGISQEVPHKWNCFNCSERGKRFQSFSKKYKEEIHADADMPDPDDEQLERRQVKKSKPVEIDQSLAAKYQKKISLKNREAKTYLKKGRGFSDTTIEHFQLGSWKTNGFEYVSLPFWKRGKLVNIKFRAVSYEDRKWKWRRLKGGESSLFHDDVLDHEFDHIFLTEAEFDCVALWNAGIKNVVAVTTGAKSFKQEWYDRLERFKKIYLVYDNDLDGQDGAKKAAERLGLDRCFNIVLPKTEGEKKTDCNNYFWDEKGSKKRHSKSDFMQLVKGARKFEVPDVMLLSDAIKEVYRQRLVQDEDELVGLTFPWKKTTKIAKGGTKPGHLVVVSGASKTGKTTWVLNWMRHLGNEGITSFVYECEMRQTRMAEKTIRMETLDVELKGDDFTDEDIFWANYILPTDKIYLGYPQTEELTLENVCAKIKSVVQRYGVKFVCFDNLHFLVRSDNVKDEIGRVTREFKLLAERLNIVFCLIVHPRKIGHKEPTPDDLKDSSSIYQDLDTLIFLHRAFIKGSDKDGEEEHAGYDPLTKVTITGRWCDGGASFQYFDGARALFYERGDKFNAAIQKRATMRKQQVKGKGDGQGRRN